LPTPPRIQRQSHDGKEPKAEPSTSFRVRPPFPDPDLAPEAHDQVGYPLAGDHSRVVPDPQGGAPLAVDGSAAKVDHAGLIPGWGNVLLGFPGDPHQRGAVHTVETIGKTEDAELGPGHDDPGSTAGTDGTVADACGVEALPAFLADVLGILVEPVEVLGLAGFLGFGSTACLLCGSHLFDGLGGEAVDEKRAGALDLKLEHPEVGRSDDERFDGLRGCRLGGCCHL
jgi:hypothetical protein